jgi:hypothetical protein
MRRMPWLMYLWPGLAQLWSYGSWGGLALALGAAVLLNLLLMVSFGWSELIGESLRNTLWVSFGVGWVATAGWSASRSSGRAHNRDSREDPFVEAMNHYLKGDYYQAEHVLAGLLRRNVRDLEARLMLATLMRRTGRPDEAMRQLDTLARFEGAGKWDLEIQKERQLLAEGTITPHGEEHVRAIH